LLLLKGETVKMPAQKNLYSGEICVRGNVAIFATSKEAVTYRGSYKATDCKEDDMMASRWRVFEFRRQLSQQEQKDVSPCTRCFAELLLY